MTYDFEPDLAAAFVGAITSVLTEDDWGSGLKRNEVGEKDHEKFEAQSNNAVWELGRDQECHHYQFGLAQYV